MSRRRRSLLFSGPQQEAALRSPPLLFHRPRRHCRRLHARKQQQKHQRLPPRHGHESMTGSTITISMGSHYQQEVCRTKVEMGVERGNSICIYGWVSIQLLRLCRSIPNAFVCS
ncbi:hypothetical protein MUK42_20149 [Musa troglodytarum]|uniref:Uncharacterized protein n=1 Tax=Musa troglodytarum TaxID=320322 RepID=A0A9E7EDW7_9LILI|nr:hypothetical protein MUK42_20149 [Musa troglodytarum]